MRPDKLTLHEVFEKERRYVIPLYQRSYVCNQEEQLEPLWDDMRQQAQRHYDPQSGGTHFLGAVVWSNRPIVGRPVAKADVIDGQQRLTTIQICLAALRDCAGEIGAEPMPTEADLTSERCRSRIIHSIRNLTLLTQSLNAAVSNGPFPAKRKRIASNSDLKLNAWLRSDERQSWSETDIINRGETLFERALAIWPRPVADN